VPLAQQGREASVSNDSITRPDSIAEDMVNSPEMVRVHCTRPAGAIAKLVGAKNVEDFWRGSRGAHPPGSWTTTASVLLQVIEMKGDAKDTPVDQGVDHMDHPRPSPKQSVWRPLHLDDYNAHYAHPYRWTYTGQPLVRATPFSRTRRQQRHGRAWLSPRKQRFERFIFSPRPYKHHAKTLAKDL
jgi:hypothetical protein